MSFSTLPAAFDRHTRLCVGIDPSPDVLVKWGLPDTSEGLARFCSVMAQACAHRVAMVKPQVAFFERFGPEGLEILRSFMRAVQSGQSHVLVDAKRGDIGSTMEGYARAWLGAGSAFGGDSMTLLPYMGFGSLAPVLTRARETNTGTFVVVRSSNPEGTALQEAAPKNAKSVALMVCDEITQYNRATYGNALGAVGAVIGATLPDAQDFARALSHSYILAPGIGAQGATFTDAKRIFAGHLDRVIVPISRGLLMAGPKADDVIAAIEEAKTQMRGLVEV